uniref:ORF-45 protein n=1 Tax=Lymantria dispar multicapsid nuclear polyhedrosis virus TaxID=10449 RepID=V9TKW1_NPVLD|nr:ORF-45 protein [Lymantria dispar multiple nucleopolyhedrovirus]
MHTIRLAREHGNKSNRTRKINFKKILSHRLVREHGNKSNRTRKINFKKIFKPPARSRARK